MVRREVPVVAPLDHCPEEIRKIRASNKSTSARSDLRQMRAMNSSRVIKILTQVSGCTHIREYAVNYHFIVGIKDKFPAGVVWNPHHRPDDLKTYKRQTEAHSRYMPTAEDAIAEPRPDAIVKSFGPKFGTTGIPDIEITTGGKCAIAVQSRDKSVAKLRKLATSMRVGICRGATHRCRWHIV